MNRLFSSLGFQLSSGYRKEPTSIVSTQREDGSATISQVPIKAIRTEQQQPFPTHSTMHINLPTPLTSQPVRSPSTQFLSHLPLSLRLNARSRSSTKACPSPLPLLPRSTCEAAAATTKIDVQDTIPTNEEIDNPSNINAKARIMGTRDRVIMEVGGEEGMGIIDIRRCRRRGWR
jgi:hypothetical protein